MKREGEPGAAGGATSGGAAAGVRCASPAPEDYVMVQADNIPSDHSASSAGSQRPPSSVDLNAIFRLVNTLDCGINKHLVLRGLGSP